MDSQIQTLTFREYNENDKGAILELWKHESGWGGITMEQFDSWFINTPYGKCLIVVAENQDKEMVGQVIGSPSKVFVDGIEIKSLRIAAPIIKTEYRHNNIQNFNHPAYTIFREIVHYATIAGYQYLYYLPAFGWLKILNSFYKKSSNPSGTASFDCFGISLITPESYTSLNDDYCMYLNEVLTEEYNVLWKQAIEQMPIKCGIVRKIDWLKWSIGDHMRLELRRKNDENIVGYMAIEKKSGLISDVLARNPEDLKLVFLYGIDSLHELNPKKIPAPFTLLKGMITIQTLPILKDLPYSKVNFKFAFGFYVLDTNIPYDRMLVENWYMTPIG